MSRVLITGSASHLKSVVEALHGARTLHITDYNEQYPDFRIGRPLEGAESRSEILLKLRATSKTLGIEGAPPAGKLHSAEWARLRMDELISLLEKEVAARNREMQGLEASLREAEKKNGAVQPFAELPLPFEAYRPYESLAVFTGTVKTPIQGELPGLGGRFELFQARPDGLLALFVEKRLQEAAEKLLARHEFSEVKAPPETGMPREVLEEMEAEMAAKRSRVAELRAGMGEARERYRDEILACAEELSIEIQKAEAPLHFATTPASFVIEGWIPSDGLDATENAVLKAAGNHVFLMRMEEQEWLEEGECSREVAGRKAETARVKAGADRTGEDAPDPYDCVPITLSNPGPVKPFEALTELFSLPSYKELDPTVLLALIFPFFFGLMIGDLGYGVLLILTGIIFRRRLRKWEGFPEIGAFIIAAGIVAMFLGLFVFGEAFGLPFHAPEEGEASWSSLTGFDIPLKAMVNKLETSGIGTLLVFSVLAGIVHLCLGNLLGVANEWGRNRRHAAAKLGWFFTVLGFGLFILKAGSTTSLGSWLWSGPLAVLGPSIDLGIGFQLPYASVAFLLAGVALAAAGEGGMAFLEVITVFSNILSYTRLAAIGIAKAAMAFAFNSLLIPLVTGGNIGWMIAGWFFLVVAHMLVFVLGGLSSGIQAIRLNLVEFFMKFYKGGGTKFDPFGRVRKYTSEQGG